jgi:hypothetical protein
VLCLAEPCPTSLAQQEQLMITSWPGPWQDIDDKTRRMLTTCSQFSQRPTVSLSYSYTGPPLPPDWCAWGSPTITQCDRWTPGRYPSVALGDTRHSLSRSVDTPMPILDHHGHACRGQFPRSQLPMSRAACVCGSVCVSQRTKYRNAASWTDGGIQGTAIR